MAEFYMARKQFALLLDPMRQAVFSDIRPREPQFDHYTQEKQANILSAYTHIDPLKIRQWLQAFEHDNHNEHDVWQI